jgi:competence protein ComFC
MNVVCAACGRYEACPDCSRRSHTYLDVNRSAVRYDDKMKELLARYKYRGDERLQTVMGGMLVHAWNQALAKQNAIESDTSVLQVITFVPVSERRFMERGFNQAEQMARELGRRVGVPVIPLLQRVRHTDKQSFKKRSDRLDDLQHVFDVDEAGVLTCTRMRGSFSSVSLYIVDDVYTTGSTMHECAKVLKARMAADCYGVTWAR